MSDSFKEIQHYPAVTKWVLILSTTCIVIGMVMSLIIVPVTETFTLDTDMKWALLFACLTLVMIVSVVCVWYAYTATLETRVDRLGISYRLLPILTDWNTIFKEDIQEWKMVKKLQFQFSHFAGLPNGIMHGLMSKKISLGSRYQLMLHLQNGKKIYIGTNMPEELGDTIKKLTNRQTED